MVKKRGDARPGKLTVLGARAKKKSGYYADGGNLYLRIAAAGSKSWAFVFTREGKTREMGLGGFHEVSIERARELATQAREALAAGTDPIEARQAEEGRRKAAELLERARRVTFKTACERYVELHRSGWRNAKHAQQWENTLAQFAYPIMGDTPVRDIGVHHVLDVLRPIWHDKTETASRLRGRIESVLGWAGAAPNYYREGPNPAAWKGNLQHSLPAPGSIMNRGHHESMPFADVPAFVARLRGEKDATARALEFAILTGARTKEIISATWAQIDWAAKVWVCPPEVMKMRKEHRVPLTPRCMDILIGQKATRTDDNEHIFPGRKTGQGLSNMALSQLLERMAVEGATVHGFRSSFRTWGAERTTHPREICEAALAHDVAGAVEGAYQRGTYLERRRKLMEAWAGHCNTVHLGQNAGGVHFLVLNG